VPRGSFAKTGRAALAAMAIACAGCGSQPDAKLPPAAEPASSPPVATRPAGRVVAVGTKPEGIAVDPVTRLAAVALRDPGRVALVDVRTGRVARRVAVPGTARHLQLAAPGGPVLVPAEPADRLARIALPGGAVSSVSTGHQPHDATRAGRRDFVADELSSTLSVFDGARAVGRAQTALQPGGVASADNGQAVGVVSVRARKLELFDARTLRRVGVAAAGTGPTHVVSDGGNYLYVADTEAESLLVFRIASELHLTRRYPLPGAPYGIAFDAGSRRIWVTLTATNELVELTAGARPRELRRFPAVRQPNSVGVDSATGRVFVTGKVDGVLQLLDPPRR
jgi:DNA-binding beta-propeller fold protein YncE